jgi:hypothetical protein
MPGADEPAVSNARRLNREAQNEQRFRVANDPVSGRAAGGRAVRFVCECARSNAASSFLLAWRLHAYPKLG